MNELPQDLERFAYDDGIDLRKLYRALWAGKWLIGGITISTTIVAVVVVLILPDIYRAEALLAPNDPEGAGGLSAMAAQYGGLANLAGINLGGGQVDKTALGLEILKSRRFISEFIDRHDILVPLMAAKGWDAETGNLDIDSDVYDVESNEWVSNARPPKKAGPSAQAAHNAFSQLLSVSKDKSTGLVTVAIEHYSPQIAKQWVDWLVDDLNSSIMRQDVAQAEQAIEYLNKQIANTSLANLQSVFFNLIQEQTKTVMLARVTEEYLFRTIDPPVVPEMNSKPKRSLIVILSTLLGFALALAVNFVATSIHREKTQ